MNNLVLQRFFGAKGQDVVSSLNKTVIPNDEQQPPPVQNLSPIVPIDVLRAKLLEKLSPKPRIINEDGLPSIALVHFANIIEFVHWYENNKSAFSEHQQKPLASLIEARNMLLGACNCDRDKRRFIADDYFKKFWTQNKLTDLLPTLQKYLKTKKIIFGDFLVYPS